MRIVTRMQKRVVSMAAMGLVAWLLAFAVHIHSLKDAAGEPHTKAHACLVCAAFQPGAGAPSLATITAPGIAAWAEPLVILPARFVRAFTLYRSRAPPRA